MVHRHVCQEHWNGVGGMHVGYLLTTVNDGLSLSSPKEDAETKARVHVVNLGNES